MKTKEKIHVFVDESGTFHSDDKYFVLGGLVVSDETLSNVRNKYRKLVKPYLVNEAGDIILDELKSTWFKKRRINRHIELIETMGKHLNDKPAILFSLIVDVEKHKQLSNLDGMKNIKNQENLRYNYFLKTIIRKLIVEYSEYIKDKDIELKIRCDERTTKISAKHDLSNYLRIEIASENEEINEITVKYLRSKDNYLIQLADMVAGLKFKEFNREISEEQKKRINKINNFFSKTTHTW